jgi:hypothetical protein
MEPDNKMQADIEAHYRELDKRMQRDEPLRAELREYVQKNELGFFFNHPLHQELFFNPERAAQVHYMLELKEKKVQELLAKGDFYMAIATHERPFRAHAFLEYEPQMPDRQYWESLAYVWMDSEKPGVNKELFLLWFESTRPERESLMEPSEHEEFAAMPDPIPVYRGHVARKGRKHTSGLSWTTDRDKAVWFAKRFKHLGLGKPMLTTGLARKQDVLAYFTGREESEIVIDPAKVSGRTAEKV